MEAHLSFAIDMAKAYGGRIYGDFVEQVLLPHHLNEVTQECKIVNFWFPTEEDCTQFTLRMGNKFHKVQSKFNLFILGDIEDNEEEYICNLTTGQIPECITYDGEFHNTPNNDYLFHDNSDDMYEELTSFAEEAEEA